MSLADESARVVQDRGNGFTEVVEMDQENDKQRWGVAPGNQIINVGSGKALTADVINRRGGSSWMFDTEDEFAIRKGTNSNWNRRALTLKSNGDWVSLSRENYGLGASQRFLRVPMAWVEAPGTPVQIRDGNDNVVEGDVDAGMKMVASDSANSKQVWIKKDLEDGTMVFFNKETNFPLMMNENYLWTYPSEGLLAATKNGQTWDLTIVVMALE